MVRVVLLISALLLVSCNRSDSLQYYRCSPEQFEHVIYQSKHCESAEFSAGFCFATSKISICDPINSREEKQRGLEVK